MIYFFQIYLLKLSVALFVMYAFYHIVLRPLTFYQWNRYYLMLYSLLAFLLPFINITPWATQKGLQHNELVKMVPSLDRFSTVTTSESGFSDTFLKAWPELLLVLFLTGVLFLLLRLLSQYYSLLTVRRKAVLLAEDEGIKMYEIDDTINPFSFGSAIYVNRRLHPEPELRRMIEHELVHVRQRHTIDLLIGEWVCIINWFNPFAWLIRRAIRQNLEFIADNQVLSCGVNRKEYQYLLLKAAASPAYRIAHHFSFSHLKKRIAMMNKLKSAKAHLLKFLFVLPLLMLLLAAFRKQATGPERVIWLAGLVVDAGNNQPIANAVIDCAEKNVRAVTDSRGYYELKIPYENRPLQFVLLVSKQGYGTIRQTENWGNFYEDHIRMRYQYSGELFGLQKGGGSGFSALVKSVEEKKDLNYEYVKSQLWRLLKEQNEVDEEEQLPGSVAGESEAGPAEGDDDAEKAPAETMSEPVAESYRFIDSPPLPPTVIREWPKEIKGLEVINNKVTVVTKTGQKEYYDFNIPGEKKAFESKYGALPPPPPPPTAPHAAEIPGAFNSGSSAPVAPVAPGAPGRPAPTTINNKGYKLSVADDRGECVIIIRNRNEKIVKAVLLTEWNAREQYYLNRYGEIPPASPAQPAPPPPPVKRNFWDVPVLDTTKC